MAGKSNVIGEAKVSSSAQSIQRKLIRKIPGLGQADDKSRDQPTTPESVN